MKLLYIYILICVRFFDFFVLMYSENSQTRSIIFSKASRNNMCSILVLSRKVQAKKAASQNENSIVLSAKLSQYKSTCFLLKKAVALCIYLGNPNDLLFLPEWKKATFCHHIPWKCLQAFWVYCRRFFPNRAPNGSSPNLVGAPPLDPSCHCPFLTSATQSMIFGNDFNLNHFCSILAVYIGNLIPRSLLLTYGPDSQKDFD